MKFSFTALLLLSFAAVAYAQTPVASQQPNPDLRIVNANWRAQGGTWDNGIDFGDTVTTTVAGAMAGGHSLMNASGNSVTYHTSHGGLSKARGYRTPVNAIATVLVKNTSPKTIKAFDLDYVFRDNNNSEFLRYRFHSKDKIKPDSTKKITQEVFQKVGRYNKRYTPVKPKFDQILQTNSAETKVIVRRIEYADGSVWERP